MLIVMAHLQCCDKHEYGKKHNCRKPHPDAFCDNAAHILRYENFVIAAVVGPAPVLVALHSANALMPATAEYETFLADTFEVQNGA